MIKLVAFDLDGTIGDTIPMCIEAFRLSVSPYTESGLSEDEIVQTFGLNEEGMVKQIVKDQWREALDDFYVRYEAMHTMCPSPFDGIKEMIKELKSRNVIIVLITSKGKGSCDITLRQFGMEDYFDFIVTGSPEKNIKTEALQEIRNKYGLQSDEMVYVGDTVSDIQSCEKAGVQCLSAGWATSANIQQLEEHNKNYIFSSIEKLREYLLDRL